MSYKDLGIGYTLIYKIADLIDNNLGTVFIFLSITNNSVKMFYYENAFNIFQKHLAINCVKKGS